jgi:hypothetical protein
MLGGRRDRGARRHRPGAGPGEAAAVARRGWHQDPWGYYPGRYHDGQVWTSLVRDPLRGLDVMVEPVSGCSAVLNVLGDQLLIRWDNGVWIQLPLTSWLSGDLSFVGRPDGSAEMISLRMVFDPSRGEEPGRDWAVEGAEVTVLFERDALDPLQRFLEHVQGRRAPQWEPAAQPWPPAAPEAATAAAPAEEPRETPRPVPSTAPLRLRGGRVADGAAWLSFRPLPDTQGLFEPEPPTATD